MRILLTIKIFIFLLIFISGIPASLFAQDNFHYEPVQGKAIAIWPNWWQEWSVDFIKNFKEEYGFSKILLISTHDSSAVQYENALTAGYNTDDIMIQIWDHNYEQVINNFEAGYYYLDEPVEHDCSGDPSNPWVSHIFTPDEMNTISNLIHQNYTSSQFIIGGYKRCNHFITAEGIADQVMYSSYDNWNDSGIPFCDVSSIGWGSSPESFWLKGATDQSSSWEDMHNRFGNKFTMSWANGSGDEYTELFQTANSIGLDVIWLYSNSGNDYEKIAEFCDAAWQAGWLNKIDDSFIEAPTNLIVQSIELGEISLAWDDNSNNENGFIIERKKDSENDFTEIAQTEENINSYTDDSVEPGINYIYRVKAVNDNTESDYSNLLEVTSASLPGETILFSPPDNSIFYSSEITFRWYESEFADGYNFEVAADSNFQEIIFQYRSVSDTTITLTFTDFDKTYFWRVRGTNDYGFGNYSEIYSFEILTVKGSVSGNIYFYNSQNQPVAEAKIILNSNDDSFTDETFSDSEGYFLFENLDDGEYEISVEYEEEWAGGNSSDALAISRYFQGLTTFDSFQTEAADVNNNELINNSDALSVVQRFLGIINSFPNGKPDWLFKTEPETISISENGAVVVIYLLATGDVDSSVSKSLSK